MIDDKTFYNFINTPIQYSEGDFSFPDKPLEEQTNEIIEKLETGFNKLSEENRHLRQLNINLEKQKNDELLQQRNNLEKILKEKDDEIKNHKLETLDLNVKIADIQKKNKILSDENGEWQSYISKATI